MGVAGIKFALGHIEDARRLSAELGGTDDDVKAYFFGLDGDTLSSILDEYAAIYGKGKREYAERALPEWKAGRTKMSGTVAERLYNLLPRRMPIETKYEIVHTLWVKYSPSSHRSLVVGPDCDADAVSKEVEHSFSKP